MLKKKLRVSSIAFEARAPCMERSSRTHYEVLGVDQKASLDVIKKAYQAMVLTVHPDKKIENTSNGPSFHDIQTAWQVLRENESRRLYDESLKGISFSYDKFLAYIETIF